MSAKETLIYAMLDTLVDSRIGTLMRMNPKFAIKATGSKDYHNRLSDDLVDIIDDPEFDQDFFNKLYYDRDMSTLYFSRVTRMVSYLRSVIQDQIGLRLVGDPRIGPVRLIINTYPYYLEPEYLDTLRQVLSVSFSLPEPQIEMDFRPLRDITLAWLRNIEPAMFVMYDFHEWQQCAADLPKTTEEAKLMRGSPETVMVTPGLLRTRHDYDEIKKVERDETFQDPFTFAKKAFAPAFALEVLPARYFSAQLIIEENYQMSDLNRLQNEILTMNKIAGRKQENDPQQMLMQLELIAEEFHETVMGMREGLTKGTWDELRNGLGDMLVVIFGMENHAEIPMVDDLDKIMQKNLSKFDKDYVTATQSLEAMQALGYKCEIRETEIDGVKYFPILTTESGVVITETGQRKEYAGNKFLKSINWSEEEFELSPNLPQPEDVNQTHLLKLAQLSESLSVRFAELGKALREDMNS